MHKDYIKEKLLNNNTGLNILTLYLKIKGG